MDRNVELLIRDPRASASSDDSGPDGDGSGAGGGSGSQDDENDETAGSGAPRRDASGPAPQNAAGDGGSLPFTGSDLLLVALVGAGLLAAGAGLRRLRA
jgi:hypothetical protein